MASGTDTDQSSTESLHLEESGSKKGDSSGLSEGLPQEKKEAIAKHPFSEPWDDSDLILVVEEKKFHVHRQIMSVHSPVFKAMLKSMSWKEAGDTEISLPRKKADEFLDFLELLYLKVKEGIDVNKMSHILRLADEYQADGVHDLCGKALRDVPKSQSNAMKIFLLTTQTAMAREDERLDLVRSQCKEIAKNMDLVTIRGSSDFQNLDRDACESLLGERIVRLEKFVSQIYPQFIGLIEYCLHLGLECKLPGLTCCPVHFPGGTHKVNTGLPRRIGDCSVCKQMIKQMVNSSRTSRKPKVPSAPTIRLGFGGMRDQSTPDASQEHVYGGDHRFDGEVISIVNDFTQIRRYMPLEGTKDPGFLGNIRFEVPKIPATSGFNFGSAFSTGLFNDNPR